MLGGVFVLAPVTTSAGLDATVGASPGRDLLDTHSPSRSISLPGRQAGTCDDDAISIETFISGQVGLSAETKTQLDRLVDTLSGLACSATIYGYASNDGSAAANLQVATQRARAVMAYLTDTGADITSVTAIGIGATTQFGPRLADNRRVVIQVHAP